VSKTLQYCIFAGALSAVLSSSSSAGDIESRFIPTSQYEPRKIDGWTVAINRHLITDQQAIGTPAIKLLEQKLLDIDETVPAKPCEKLKKVKIWLGVNDGYGNCEYHPSREWLSQHGFNPDKARCVEVGNASCFLHTNHEQPMAILHELAHAYHDRLGSSDKKEIRETLAKAKKEGLYACVPRNNGTMCRAYALTNEYEYFAESTEAYFGRNDFFPFVRTQLEDYDPRMAALLERIWGTPRIPAIDDQRITHSITDLASPTQGAQLQSSRDSSP
jgi:hypothetical protein